MGRKGNVYVQNHYAGQICDFINTVNISDEMKSALIDLINARMDIFV